MDCYLFPNKPGVSAALQSSAIPKFPRINSRTRRRHKSVSFGPLLSPLTIGLSKNASPPCRCAPAAVPSPLSCSAQQAGDPHTGAAWGLRRKRRPTPARERPHARGPLQACHYPFLSTPGVDRAQRFTDPVSALRGGSD